MTRLPPAAVAVVCLLAVSPVAFLPVAPALADVPDARLTVTGVDVAPDTVTAGAPATLTPTVSLAGGSASAVTLDRVSLVDTTGERIATAEDLGTLSPGGSYSVPLTTTFDRPGRQSLQVVVKVTDADNETVRATRPVSVSVARGAPLVEVRAPRGVVGVAGPASVRVANPTTTTVRDVTVRLTAAGADEPVGRRTLATLGAGASTNLSFSLRPSEAGVRDLRAVVDYTTPSGTRETVRGDGRLRVDPLEADVGVRVEPAPAGEMGGGTDLLSQLGLSGLLGGATAGAATEDAGGESGGPETPRVLVTITNFGNVAAEDVTVEGPTGRLALSRLAPGGSDAAVVSLATVDPSGPVRFEATYTVASGARRLSTATTYDYRPKRADVSVTGVSLSFDEEGRLLISGNAGNTGRADVTGVVVAVGESDAVEPAYPQRDYFVGTIEASEFAPFDLTADVDPEAATTVPVVISYAVDGQRRTERVELPYDRSLTPPDEDTEGRGVPPWILAVVLGLVAVLVLIVVGYAQRRGG